MDNIAEFMGLTPGLVRLNTPGYFRQVGKGRRQVAYSTEAQFNPVTNPDHHSDLVKVILKMGGQIQMAWLDGTTQKYYPYQVTITLGGKQETQRGQSYQHAIVRTLGAFLQNYPETPNATSFILNNLTS